MPAAWRRSRRSKRTASIPAAWSMPECCDSLTPMNNLQGPLMRSTIVVLLGITTGALIGAFRAQPVAAEVKSGSDWPCFLGPLGTSVSLEKGIAAPWPKDGPRVVWQRKIGIGYSAPVVSNGKLYLFHRKASLVPNVIAVHGWAATWGAPANFSQAVSGWVAMLDPSLFDRFGKAATLT